jgi:uncharacterized protein
VFPIRITRTGTELVWSRYNKLVHSPRLGHFLYNALSNSLFELDSVHYRSLERCRDLGTDWESISPEFLAVLRQNYVITTKGEEQRVLLSYKYRRDTKNFDSSRLGLTICPTLKCNFRCPYCFEHSQGDPRLMSPQTIDLLIDFIKSYRDVRHLALTWYGGEPLMGFDVICTVTRRLKSLDLNFEGASLITNGYFMDQRKCALFNDLQIHSVQVTLDGPEAIHDKRRFLAGGGPTFRHIMANLETLLDSSYKGSCEIRVNIDRENADAFQELQDSLLERFRDKNVIIYAARVTPADGYDSARLLDLREWTDFNYRVFQSSGVVPISNFYPSVNLDSVCVATTHNRFVVGPRGELYKCWEDVGNPAREIGDLHKANPITNSELRAQYSSGTDAYSDPECLECAVLPICGGGCANKRLRVKHFDEPGLQYCSPFKDNLVQYLEAYIDIFMNREMCVAILGSGQQETPARGYRKISPEAKPNCGSTGSCSQCS